MNDLVSEYQQYQDADIDEEYLDDLEEEDEAENGHQGEEQEVFDDETH